MEVAGPVVSIVQVWLSAAPVLPDRSVARTAKVCSPSARPAYAAGLLQAANASPSRAHSKVAPVSALNVKLAPVPAMSVSPIVVAGPVVSISAASEKGDSDVTVPQTT